jgi:hypothetical protein
MTKGSLIEYQALKIAQLEQEIERLKPHESSEVEVRVNAGIKLCDWHGLQVMDLAAGTNVRVNRSGSPYDPFLFAKVVQIGKRENTINVNIEIEGIPTYAGMVALSHEPFANMVTKQTKYIEVKN